MRVFGLFVLVMLLMLFPLQTAVAAPALPGISGQSAALIDMQTGSLLGGINLNQKIYPASTTKLLTAMLVLERSTLEDSVTISRKAQDQDGTSLYTREGETYLEKDLIYAMLVQSCNDAAVALAEHVAGTVEAFAELMNQKAVELGATGSHFVNPNGLPDNNHYSTAADMARIFAAAMQNATIREITSTRVYRVTIGSGEERILVNGNDLLTEYDGTVGGKTGYTPEAGQCILTAAARDGMELGVTVFKAQGKSVWSDAKSLLNFGFSHWRTMSIVETGQSVTAVSVRYGANALLVADQAALLTVPVSGQADAVSQKVQLQQPLQAPLLAGTVVGTVTYWRGDQAIASVPLRVAADVPRLWYTYWQVPLTMAGLALGLRLRNRVRSSAHMLIKQQPKTRRG